MKERLSRLLQRPLAPRNAPLPLSIREAWLAHERYSGRRVVLVGVVHVFEVGTSTEYFTLDDGPNRVGLRGDVATMREHSGRQISATGLLVFKPGDGIFLVAEVIQLVA